MDWPRDGRDWPNREHSRFVQAGGLRWHVQVFECVAQSGGAVAPFDAPVALLLHGTGASTHSWRDVAPLLAKRYTVVAPDLPGHAFTGIPPGGAGAPQLSLPGMARAIASLMKQLEANPALIIGHSAGAAIAIRMVLDRLANPRRIVGINAALMPLGGLAGQWFSPAAKVMAAMPLIPRLFAWRAQNPVVLAQLLGRTGSVLDVRGTALYHRLVSDRDHVAGALAMMANWDLPQLARDLPKLAVPLDLIVGEQDRTVPPADSRKAMERLAPDSRGTLTVLPSLGHLAHEEAPAAVVACLPS
ncbi:alpha/beta fold hydrolase BchO [Hydrogenophaga sp.]|uniref:alpha/beta fold hydrolase BchO n=1 Tax=Hydrogenophaga sp. TaxID=1904254 RepID=UPI00271D36F2|nr:alpha/beta fold hydrolase BchO [Hydrogenophaga sp.]MDO8905885.1 alpha/beta fold hydrolase [Hydrogenophaga sp.]